ncbi:phage tail tape measure protein [Virgibacillus salexigens]
MNVTAPIVAGGVAIFKAASDFESAFAGVEKTVDGTEQQMQGLRESIRDMAKEIPASTTEIAAVAEAAGQLGIKTESIEEFTRTMINLGEATNMTSDQAATEFARFANIVGMSQDDFDKLGSTVVALGNNLATTETEISSMAMRLAGAGKQVGLSEADIMSFAAALSSVGIEAEAGGSAFSKVMVEMQLAAEQGGDGLKNFADVAGMSASDFKKAYQEDATKAITAFIEGLSTAEDRGLSAIGILDEMGIKEVRLRDTLLRAAGASDVFSESLEIGSKAWEENTALTEEAEKRYATTESQMKILWNRIKDIGITLGEALVPAVMDAIDAAEPLIQKIESGAEAFADMDEQQQQTILKMIGLVAAIGPASVALGGITTTIGGLLKVGGGLTGLLGKSGGAGLLGRFGLMGVTGGPVGIAIAGVGALSLAIGALSQASNDNLEDTLKSIEAREDELDTLDQSIERFDELQNKNKLSTDEVLRYMDVMSELKGAKNEDTIKALTEEQEELLKKSGLTNDEMEEFLGLNDEIVEKSPATTEAISEQGNAYATTTEKVKELSEAERARLTEETYQDITSNLDKQRENLEKQKELQEEINTKESEQAESSQRILDLSAQLRDQDLVVADLKTRISEATGAEKRNLEGKLILEQQNLDEIARQLGIERLTNEELNKQIDKKENKLDKTNKELNQFDQLLDKYALMVLEEQGIVAEKGKGLETLRLQQLELDQNRQKLKDLKAAGEITTSEYQTQNNKLDDQQRKIDAARGKLEDVNAVAGKTIYKDVNISTNPSIEWVNRSLSGAITKTVNLDIPRAPIMQMLRGYAEGTDFHPGGPAIVGEEGPELIKEGNRWSLAGFGLLPDLNRGAQVFTTDESKKIIRALNSTPGYASGASPTGEAARIVSQLNNNFIGENSNQIVALLRNIDRGIREGKVIQIDGQPVTQIVNENNAVSNLGSFFD